MHEYILIASFVIFIVFKWEYVGLPYYWDEAWVYAPAVKEMVRLGPRFSPDAISSELSRGHPVLFHFVSAVWMNLTGVGRLQAHLLALGLSIALFLTIYMMVSVTSDKTTALGTTMSTMLSEPILAQSGMLFPEIMLTLLIIVSFTGYIIRNALVYAVFGTAALLTKESAIIFVVSVIIWQVYLLIIKGRAITTQDRKWLAISILPVVASSLYFLWQYRIHGWFLFPDHLGLMSISARDVTYKAKLVFIDTFERQGMLVLVYTVCFVAVVLYEKINIKNRILGIVIFVAAIKILFGRWELPTSIVPFVSFGLLACIFIIFIPSIFTQNHRRGELIGISYIFLISYWLFSSLNFYTPRYTIAIIPFVFIILLVFAHEVFANRARWALPILAGITCVVLLIRVGRDEHIGDTRLNYRDAIQVHSNLVHYAERHGLFDERIQASFMQAYYMQDPDAGYLSTDRVFPNVKDSLDRETSFALITNGDPSRFDTLVMAGRFTEIWRTRSGIVHGSVYRRDASE